MSDPRTQEHEAAARGLFDSFAMQADKSVCKCDGRGKRCPECVACIRGIAAALADAVRVARVKGLNEAHAIARAAAAGNRGNAPAEKIAIAIAASILHRARVAGDAAATAKPETTTYSWPHVWVNGVCTGCGRHREDEGIRPCFGRPREGDATAKPDRFLPGVKVRDLRGGPESPIWRVVLHQDNGNSEVIRLRRTGDDTDEREIRCPDFYGEGRYFEIIEGDATPGPEPDCEKVGFHYCPERKGIACGHGTTHKNIGGATPHKKGAGR